MCNVYKCSNILFKYALIPLPSCLPDKEGLYEWEALDIFIKWVSFMLQPFDRHLHCGKEKFDHEKV